MSEGQLSLVLITGMSGSGKSVALQWLEDVGYACVDNLPVSLLPELVANAKRTGNRRLAVAIDSRSQGDLRQLPELLSGLRSQSIAIRVIFLDADDATLVQRYSESRRRHPLANRIGNAQQPASLQTCIALERELLDELRDREHVIDTSGLKPVQLRHWMRDLVKADRPGLIISLESFAYKQGAPRDADLVFDVRCLPNPHYHPELKALTGMDQPVKDWLCGFEDVGEMIDDIEAFMRKWLPRYTSDTRNYLNVAIGCTGGQHRSVFVVQALAQRFKDMANLLTRHRQQPQFSESIDLIDHKGIS
jgi:UPF0042 nucleotide-binding protein